MSNFSKHNFTPVIPMSHNERVLKNSVNLSGAYKKITERIESDDWNDDELPASDRRLGLFAFFAAINSGVCRHEVLLNIVNKLIKMNKPLHCSLERFHFDVDAQITGLAFNSNDGEQRTSLFRAYIECFAQSAAHAYLRSRSGSVNQNLCEEGLLELINQLIGGVECRRFDTLQQFCEAAINLAFRLPGINISLFLKEFSRGAIPSHAMPLYCLDAFDRKRTRPEFFIKPLPRVFRKKYGLTKPKSEFIESDVLLHRFYRMLLQCCTVDLKLKNEDAVQAILVSLYTLYAPAINISYAEEMLLAWLIDGLKSNRWKSPFTPTKYIRLIGKDWLRITNEIDVANLDGAEMDEICDQILLSRDDHGNKEGRLRDLIIFGIGHAELTPPDNPFFSVTDCKNYVRSIIIPEYVTIQARHDLRTLLNKASTHIQQTMDILFLLMSRGLFRPTELLNLRIKDFELSPEGWFFLRGSKLKNPSSKRKIRIKLLLLEDEYLAVESFIKNRKSKSHHKSTSLLFSTNELRDEGISTTYLEETIGQVVSNILGVSVPVYQYRHTGITIQTIIAFGSDKLITELTPYSPKVASTIRLTIHDQRKRDRLWQIAGLAGHCTPKTTLYSYSHVLDLLLYERLSNYNQKHSAQFWRNLSQLSSEKIRNIQENLACPNEEKCNPKAIEFTANHLGPALSKNLKRFTLQSGKSDRRKFKDEPPAPIEVKADMALCIKALNIFDQLSSDSTYTEQTIIALICLELPLNEETVSAWVRAAKALHINYRTNKKPRLTVNDSKICPSKPKSKLEQKDADQILQAFRGVFKKNRSEGTWCLEYLLNNITNHKTYISFSDPEHLQRFLKFCSKFIAPERWHLSITEGKSDSNKSAKWRVKCVMPYLTTSSTRNATLARLYFLHPDMSLVEKHETYGTNSLKYIFVMIKIMLEGQRLMHLKFSQNVE